MRAYKTVSDSYIEPISFTVPRRAETFQADIFPPAFGTKPAVGAKEWLDGKTGIPAKIDFESIYEGGAPKEIPSDYKPAAQPAPVEPKKEEPRKQQEAKPVAAVRAPPPSMNDQKSSISAMANKFQDNDEDGLDVDADDASSFEEIPKPVQRQPASSRAETKSQAAPSRSQPAATSSPEPAKSVSASKLSPAPAAATTIPSPSTPAVGVETSLDQIKQLLENQTKMINAQNDKINVLVGEVEALKRKVNTTGSQDQIERIRQLELELEAARS